ncbi:hypothetical protein J6590_027729 [Homalodisca vitripennis]|nr:hypothetical protein J6590_027729 [Homalodisca vitripennis]
MSDMYMGVTYMEGINVTVHGRERDTNSVAKSFAYLAVRGSGEECVWRKVHHLWTIGRQLFGSVLKPAVEEHAVSAGLRHH